MTLKVAPSERGHCTQFRNVLFRARAAMALAHISGGVAIASATSPGIAARPALGASASLVPAAAATPEEQLAEL
jgi:hypothetical protein